MHTFDTEIANCPVCRRHIAVKFLTFDGQPLSTLGWPESSEEAESMARLPVEYVQCVNCSHVWNRLFSYDAIPYRKNPNRMFNSGSNWQGFMRDTKSLLVESLPANPCVIEIGCGEGHFVREIAKSLGNQGVFLGFDPNTSSESGRGIEFYPRLFNPLEDVDKFKPDLLIMRHVLEHLTEPDEFLQSLAWACSFLNKEVKLFAEVPCIDRVFDTSRLSDFFYEHFSHFSSKSFRALLEGLGSTIRFEKGYQEEVMIALVKIEVDLGCREQAIRSSHFYRSARESLRNIPKQMSDLVLARKKIAIWGGTGKAAAFINYFRVTGDSFPLVVDSDDSKVGYFVPGTGQRISSLETLKHEKPEIVIIPMQWRVRDIIEEMKKKKIEVKTILIEHQGRLIDFQTEAHPY